MQSLEHSMLNNNWQFIIEKHLRHDLPNDFAYELIEEVKYKHVKEHDLTQHKVNKYVHFSSSLGGRLETTVAGTEV